MRARINTRRQREVRLASNGSGSRERSTALAASALCHGLFLGLAALIVIGAGHTAGPTTLQTSWGKEVASAAELIPDFELAPDISTGGPASGHDPDVTFASTDTGPHDGSPGLSVSPGNGFGGAFFGAGESKDGTAGRKIVYIVDASGSMREPLIRATRFTRVRMELDRSIRSLHPQQKFAVIFFNDKARSVRGRSLRAGTDLAKDRMIEEIWNSGCGGGTDPRGAIALALRLRPDTIFFLTDGQFHASLASELMFHRTGLTVHTFTLADPAGEAVMKQIAEINGGTYRFVDGHTDTAPGAVTATTGPPAPLKPN